MNEIGASSFHKETMFTASFILFLWTCWALGTGVLAQSTTLGSLNGTVYPLPRFAVTSAYKKLFVGQRKETKA